MLVFKNVTKVLIKYFTLMLINAFFLFVVFLQFGASEKGAKDEYFIKSKYLLSFPKFVDWPAKSDVYDLRKPFIIGVIGLNPFKTSLETNAAAIRIKNKVIKIEYYDSPYEITDCNMLFISKCSEKEFKSIMSKVRRKPILIITDEQDFSFPYTMLSFYKEDNIVRFYINDEQAKESGLQISYQLLSIGKRIKPGEQE